MSEFLRATKPGVRLNCETLEDRATPALAYGLSGSSLLAFDTANPTGAVPTAITGVNPTEALVGIDFRGQDGLLYALGVNASTNNGTLYTISPQTGQAIIIGTAGAVAFVDPVGSPVDLPDPAAVGYGIDFDPTADRLRVVTGNGLNFRVNPNSGGAVDGDTGLPGSVNGINTDGAVNGLPGGSTGVSATAYKNNAGGTTTQYTLDSTSNALFIQNAPNGGTQTTPVPVMHNGAPLDFTSANGFDIPSLVYTSSSGAAGEFGVAALTVNGVSRAYEINLATGVATELGATPSSLTGLALSDVPGDVVAFTGATFTATEAGVAAEITLTRTGNINGAVAVSVTATGGTATESLDYLATSHVVGFAPGQTTATLIIPIADDGVAELEETVVLTLSAPTGGAVLGGQTTATVTIADGIPAPTPAPTPTPTPTPTPEVIAVGAGFGGGVVQILNADRSVRTGFLPYGENMRGGVRVVTGDVTGDGVADVITAPAVGAPHVKVFDGVTGAEIRSFYAFAPTFFGGITIATGDVDNDGAGDIITGTANGSSHVRAFSGVNGGDIASFFAYDGFGGGVTVATGDVNNDGRTDIITGTASGAGHVKAFDGASLALLQSYFAFRGFGGGVTVATGDVDNDGFDDIITGTASSTSHVKVFSGQSGTLIRNFRAFAPAYAGGVNVTSADVTGDGIPDVLVSGAQGTSHTKVFDGVTAVEINSFLAFGAGFTGGVFIN